MPLPIETRADIDRLNDWIRAAREIQDTGNGEISSMVYEFLCVAISGRLEQNIKQILIEYTGRQSQRRLSAPISKLCQSFQNPDAKKIVDLLSLFDKDFSAELEAEWRPDDSHGKVISDMIGLRKAIAHQTSNSRTATRTKVERFYASYVAVVQQIGAHFLP